MSIDYRLLQDLRRVRTALYIPAANARALEKARGLDADMLIIDLEDGVADAAKDNARRAAIAYVETALPGTLMAIRINSTGSKWFDDDVKALSASKADLFVLPKVDSAKMVERVRQEFARPLLAMIETPAGLYSARDIAMHRNIAGLIAGTNDIAAECGVKPGAERQGLELYLQMIVLAAAASGKPAFDGVCNQLDDLSGFEAECAQGACYGFSGKTVIHPNQIAIANMCFSPSEIEIADARALLAEAKEGASRFNGRMIEAMHIEAANTILERAGRRASD